MRKIDKTKRLSTVYQTWEESFKDKDHPPYNSSNNQFYTDIVMDLLRCQNGLCAYTEVQLCPPQYLTDENWENGRYKTSEIGRVNNGALEHFDETLKWKDKSKNAEKEAKTDKKSTKTTVDYQKKDWLWSNFFVIDSDTNNRKSDKAVDYILKPNAKHYDPFKLLDYSLTTHRYIANTDLDEDTRARITHMIDNVLGLNFPNLVDKRRQIVERVRKYPMDEEPQFPTAVEFYRRWSSSINK